MKRAAAILSLLALAALATLSAPPAPERAPWEFLSTTTIGAREFIQAHPGWDGRGVLIAVCDSGVDLSLPGLLTTSDGKPKLLDARDFTDQNRTALQEAVTSTDEHGEALHGEGGKWLYGFSKLGLSPAGGKVYAAYFTEERQRGSDVEDLNNDGDSTDTFGLVAFQDAKGDWVAVLDTDADGDLSDETPNGDFARTRQPLALGGRDRHDQASILQVAINLWPEEKEAALYFADNSHGTHVAGICAGQAIDGKAGYDGIAPGAQLLGLKLGSGIYSGGATTPGSMVSAWRYAVEKAEELKMPLVIQMSYGVGSENEGRGVAEKLLDELLADHPGVAITISAGNEGPGLTTVGMPACAQEALAVGAALAKTTAKDLYGASLSQDELFSFSSRGGEMAEPDVVCPGFAASTVPLWGKGRNVMRGTSMAAPQAAGACALLYGAAQASGLPLRRDWLYAAVQRGAVPMAGYGPAEQGPGMMNVGRAWTVYQALAGRPAAQPAAWEIVTESPERVGGKGPAAFWRGAYYPRDGRLQEVRVSPRFPAGASADYRARHMQAFDLLCSADWVRVQNGSCYTKGDEPAKFQLAYDARRLASPGVYMTEVRGYDKGLSAADRERLGPEWRLPVTVVVPETADPDSGAILRTLSVKPAKVARLFFRASGDTAGVSARLEIAGGERGAVTAALYDPEGRESEYLVLRPDRREVSFSIPSAKLERGVYELTLYGSYMNPGPVEVRAEVRPFAAPGFASAHPLTLKVAQGKAPRAELSLTPDLSTAFEGKGTGEVTGSAVARTQKLSAPSWSRTFSLAPGEASVDFEVELSAADFAKFTDIAVIVADESGKTYVNDGMGTRRITATFEPPEGAAAGAKYTFKVLAATADPDDDSPSWTLKVREVHAYARPVPLKVTQGKTADLVLYPDRTAELGLEAQEALPAAPDGGFWVGQVTLQDRERKTLKLVLDLTLKPE